MPTWLPIGVGVVTLLIGLLALGKWLRDWIRKIIHEEVSQPLSQQTKDLAVLTTRFNKHQKRVHERIDKLREQKPDGS